MMRRSLVGVVAIVLLVGVFSAGYAVGRRADHTSVPNLVGLGSEGGGQAAARRELATAGLRLGKVGWKVCSSDEVGLVVEQVPPAETVVPDGTTVDVLIGGPGMLTGAAGPCLPGKQHPASAE
jgi:beta-lactam-binding protein with PASTA domain